MRSIKCLAVNLDIINDHIIIYFFVFSHIAGKSLMEVVFFR